MSDLKIGDAPARVWPTTSFARRFPRAFNSWRAIFDRCFNPRNQAYLRYGGRGITVCERWHDFHHFVADMGERPEGMQLDRFPNNDGDYQPGNCRWATPKEQAANRRAPPPPEDISGEKFNKLTVVSRDGSAEGSGESTWLCSCDCGGSAVVRKSALRSGRIKTCGCGRLENKNWCQAGQPRPAKFREDLQRRLTKQTEPA